VLTILDAVDQAPVVEPDSYSTFKNMPLSLNPLLNDWDPEGQALRVSEWASPPQLGTISSTPDSNDMFTYTPRAAAVGQDTFAYIASDGKVSSMGNITITIGKHVRNPENMQLFMLLSVCL
jgi:hypothetical protein